MNTIPRFRFSMMAILAMTGLLVQSVAAAPGRLESEMRPTLETGQENWLELSATVGEPYVPNEQPKPESLDTVTVDSRTPSLDLPPLPPDPDKQPVDPAQPERNRDYWTTLMSENFEGSFPSGLWNVFDNNGATYGEYYWDDDDFKPHVDYWSAWVANGGVNGVDPQYNNYANNMDSWMMYGPFDLSGCSAADFEFNYWNRSEKNYDFFGWGASPNSSNVYGWQLSGSQESWTYVDFDLAPYLGDTSVWLGFIFRSDGINTDIGTFVDDVALWCLTETDVKSWTYMVYLAGDNNLESAAVDDFLEMSSVGSSADVNIVALMDRIPGYDTSYDDWTDTRRFYITTGLTPAAANGVSWGEANMGDPEVLLKFVRWAKAAYPANHYVLVFWDHGTGWRLRDPNDAPTRGVSFDDTSGGDSIDMPELRSSLSTLTGNGSSPFEIVQMDACLMAMVEVDNQIKNYANIRVGSEESEPNDGSPLNTILSALVSNPAMSATTLATDIVDFYYSSYGNGQTQSAVNLGTPYTTLNTAVNNLAVALINNGANYIAEIQTARNASTQFAYTYYIDLWDFADLVKYNPDPAITNAAVAVKNAVTAAVIHEHHGTSWPWARGISIYFPKTTGEYDTRYDGSSGFLQFTANTQWDEWIHTYHYFSNYPAMFNKSSPANGATGQNLNTVISWGSSTGATRYDICVDTSNDSACGTQWINNGINTSIMLLDLQGGSTYYWQVRAVNAYGKVYANKGAWWSFTTGNLPAAFNKTSPANDATGQMLSLPLSWASSTGATKYYLCPFDTSNDNVCNSGGNWYDVGNNTSVSVGGLHENTAYYWQVRAVNAYGTVYANKGTWWSFTTGNLPATFNKSGPANGATNQSLNPTLTWGTSTYATSYEYCYDTSNDSFCSSWTDNGTSTSKSLSGLSQYTTYYWHVRAKNTYGLRYSGGSETAFWSFTTGGLPGTFNKSDPANNATNQALNPTLTWGASTNATTYEYCYDTTDDDACSSWTSNGSSTSKSISGLSEYTTYYWHVRAKNSFGTRYSNNDDWWSFTTGGIPGTFDKSSPSNSAIQQPLSLSLSWGSSSNSTSYKYCYDTSNNDTCDGSWVDNGSSTSASIGGLDLGTTYYWHVRANNIFGTRNSNSNAWWSFTTGNVPGAFNKISPANGATNQPLSLTLSWGSSSGAVSYSYCIDSNNNNACDGSWSNAGTSTSVPIGGLGFGMTYYWHVEAFNSFGEREANDGIWWNFKTPLQATFKSVAAKDGWILESTETSNLGGTLNSSAVTFNLGDSDQKKQYRGILSFSTGALLPDNAVITKVTLKVKKSAVTGGGNPVSMFQGIMVDIKNGTFGTAALQTSDFQTLASKTYGPFMTPLSGGWYSIDLTNGKTYINKLTTLSGLTQIRLRFKLDDDNNAIANYLSLFSGNADTADRPQLIIRYYIP